jgi:hypothetical protein
MPKVKTESKVNRSNMLDYIMDFEEGSLEENDVIELFQFLVDTGIAWQLQGFYGRTAETLIEAGYVTKK